MSKLSAPWGSECMRLAKKGMRVWQREGWRGVLWRASRKILGHPPRSLSFAQFVEQYSAWIAANEPDDTALRQQKLLSSNFAHRPLISFVTPVFNPPPAVLREALESVRTQTYPNWELCLVDGNSTRPEVTETLQAYCKVDGRIRLKRLPKNLGISGNTNEGVALAQGEYIAFLDHDDLIAPNMLFEVIRLLNDKPRTDIVYFDEDKVTEDGTVRHSPLFKPDWSSDMLLSAHYLTHAVVRAELVRKVGPFRPELDGAQDWDFILRCIEQTSAVEHIPKILYHWRAIIGSCAEDIDAKPNVVRSQVQAIEQHLGRIGIDQAKVLYQSSSGTRRAVWPTRARKVSIIIPTRDKADLLKKCLTSILKRNTYENYEILLVDNGSREPATQAYYQRLGQERRVRIIPYDAPFNYSQANNLAARQAEGEFLLFLNNDTEGLTSDWIEELVRWAERPQVGVVGGLLLYPDDTVQHAGVIMGVGGIASHVFMGASCDEYGAFGSPQWYRNYSAVTGACMMIPRAAFDQVGGFDEDYELVYSDVEICLRLRAHGFRVVYTPYARLRHYESQTRPRNDPPADIERACSQMRKQVTAVDPYFNANLSCNHSMPRLNEKGEETRLARMERILWELGLPPRARISDAA